MVELKHKADGRPTRLGQLRIAERARVLAGQTHAPTRGRLEQADDVEQGALARPRGALQGNELCRPQAQANAVEHLVLDRGAHVVALTDVAKLKDVIRIRTHAPMACAGSMRAARRAGMKADSRPITQASALATSARSSWALYMGLPSGLLKMCENSTKRP